MPPNNIDRPHYSALDGIRGLAILLVVVYHNFGFINYFFFGWLGVDLFFVLSGFLITDILLNTIGNKNYLKNFYMRRVLRIFPLYYLTLIIFLIILPKLNVPLDIAYYKENQVWLWTYLQNWLYIFHHPKNIDTLNHLWSLAVEEQFYLFWPLVILLLRKPKYLLILISIVLIGVLALRLWVWNYQIADLAYFNLYTFSRIDGICIGCMVALLQRIKVDFLKKNTAWIVLFFAGLNFIFFFINQTYNYTFPYLALIGYTTFGMMFGILVNEAVTGDSKIISFIFSNPILKFFGKISYGFYIFHWPVYLLTRPFLFSLMPEQFSIVTSNFIVSILATIIGIIISLISYHFFELRFLKMKPRFS